MMTNKRLCSLLVIGLSLISICSHADDLVLELRPWPHAQARYGVASSIPLQFALINKGTSEVSVYLKEHDPTGESEPYPWGLNVKVIDENGVVLTKTDGFGDYYSSYFTSSVAYSEEEMEMPGDRILIPPGEIVLRVVNLRDILDGCLKCNLEAGKYQVQLKLGKMLSNTLEVLVK